MKYVELFRLPRAGVFKKLPCPGFGPASIPAFAYEEPFAVVIKARQEVAIVVGSCECHHPRQEEPHENTTDSRNIPDHYVLSFAVHDFERGQRQTVFRLVVGR